MAFELDPLCPAGAEVGRVIREQLDSAIKRTLNARVSATERVHLARTSCKKARAALKLIRGLDEKNYRRENDCLRKAANQLSELRDAEAMTQSFSELLKSGATATQRKKLETVRRALAAHRRKITPSSKEFERRMKEFAVQARAVNQRLAAWSPAAEYAEVLAQYGGVYKRARAALRDAKKKPGGTSFHEWRKAIKAHAYQCRLLRGVWPSAMKAQRKELKQLAASLGDEHDMTILDQTLCSLRNENALDDGRAFTDARSLVKSHREQLRTTALALGLRLFADAPRAVVRRMETWWRVTRSASARSERALVTAID